MNEEKDSGGWIKLHRKFKEWEWYQDENTKSVFIHLLLDANHKDKKWRGNTLVHENSLVQFYIVSKRGGSTQSNQREQFFQTNISQRYI